MYLGHYTNLNTLEKILTGMHIRLGPYSKTNDPYENSNLIPFFRTGKSKDGLNIYQDYDLILKRDVKSCFRLACFTVHADVKRVLNKPRMWHQYANDHNGCCLVLDKTSFDIQFQKLNTPNRELYHSKVSYDLEEKEHEIKAYRSRELIDNPNGVQASKIENKIFDKKDWFLFLKNSDWKEEREYRYLLYSKKNKDADIFCEITNSLKQIVLGDKVSQFYYEMLIDWASNKSFKVEKLTWDGGFQNYVMDSRGIFA
jgi:hypothetical protein